MAIRFKLPRATTLYIRCDINFPRGEISYRKDRKNIKDLQNSNEIDESSDFFEKQYLIVIAMLNV